MSFLANREGNKMPFLMDLGTTDTETPHSKV